MMLNDAEREPNPSAENMPEASGDATERGAVADTPEALESNATPEVSAETPEIATPPVETKIAEVVAATQERSEQRSEVGFIGAQIKPWIAEFGAGEARRYIVSTLQKQKGFEAAEAEKITDQIIAFETQSPLLENLDQDLEATFAEATPEARQIYSKELRQAFHDILAGGHLGAETINRLLPAGIVLHSEGRGEGTRHRAVACISRQESGRPQLEIFGDFFVPRLRDGRASHDQRHLVKHEIGHVAGDAIVPDALQHQLYQVAHSAEMDASTLPPYFQRIFSMLRDPLAAAALEARQGGHMERQLRELGDITSENLDAKAQEYTAVTGQALPPERFLGHRRFMVLREIIAERIANFLESDGSFESYATVRFANRNLKDAPLDEETIAQEKALFDFIGRGFQDQESWAFDANYEDEEDWFDDIDWELLEETHQPTPTGDTGNAGSSKDHVFGRIFEWLTGTGSKQKETGLKKQAKA